MTAAPPDPRAPIVLLHGSGLDGRAFARLGGRLDRRGVGWVAPDFTRIALADDAVPDVYTHDLGVIRDAVHGLAQRTGGSVRLFGHSYGGALALALASREPLPLVDLTVFEPPVAHLLRDAGDPRWDDVVGLLGSGFRDGAVFRREPLAWVRTFVDFWTGPGAFGALPPAEQARFAEVADTMFAEVHGLFAATVHASDYARIAVPVTVLQGAASPAIAHAMVQRLLQALPAGTRHLELPGGHMAPVTHPDALLGALLGG